ncbi:MAG: histidine kinase [Verrucomicrobia bacterium]|nr:histidine kinase [Verrucomicrobiota bacterium]
MPCSLPGLGVLAALLAGCAALPALAQSPDAPPPPPLPGGLAELGLPLFESFAPREYSGHTQVWTAVEDGSGVMHFGNLGRVLSFDGARWSHFDVPTTFVRGLVADQNQRIWIGGVNELGYAEADAAGVRRFVSLRDRLPAEARDFGELWKVILTPRGPLFQSNTWLLRWDGQKFATLALPNVTSGGWQCVHVADQVWLSQPRAGWFLLQDDGNSLALGPDLRTPDLPATSLLTVVPGAEPNEAIFCTGRAALFRWDGRKFHRLPTVADDILSQKRPYRACALPGGRFVIATLQAGALIFDLSGRLLCHLDERTGLPDNTVINVGADSRGGLWICLERGLVRVDARPWLSWLGPASATPRSQLATLRFRDTLYVASATGLHKLAPATGLQPARLVPVPEMPEYLSSLTDGGDVLIGLSEQGVIQYPAAREHRQIGDLNNATTFGPSRSQAGRWFALANERLHSFRRDGARWVPEGEVPTIQNVRSLFEEADGTFWLGLSSDGVLRVTFPTASAAGPGEPQITRFGVAQGLPPGHGWVRVTAAGDRLLLSCEKGLYRFDPGSQRFAPTAEFGARFADGSTTARTVIPDPRGGHWIVARASGQAELVTPLEVGLVEQGRWRALNLPQLARLDDITDLRIDQDTLWLSGHSGIIRVDLQAWRAAPPEPVPRVLLREAVMTDGSHLPLSGGWTLPYARRSLRVSFGAPALVRDAQAIFETTLRGGDESTVQAEANAERTFGALAPGQYELSVRARGNDGRWSEPLQVAFTVLPPWWASTWAWISYGGLATALVAAGVRQRTRALERRAEKLEAVVTVRTEELRKSNQELARLHRLELDERIAARLAEEKARLEVLRYQLNPHFLFNALTSVRAQLPATVTGARETIGQLTEFCRSTLLRPADGTHPTLAQEMEMLSSYLAIEKIRWGDLLEVEKDIDPAAAERRVPPLLLLPLLENALKYGRATSPDTLTVRLRASLEDGALRIEVSNTGTWVEPEQRANLPSLGIGMENLRQRLRRFYPDAHTFETTAAEGWVHLKLTLRGEPVA